ncbi:MAG: ribosomal protein S18-alanine N-acetyltransferase [Myxococcales bacterium]|nr:ribosomal protein S18-alanine N-acetyltransferase [Myxococcales bacterium]
MTPWRPRPAVEADLPAVAALDADCFGNPWSLDVYRQELLRPFARLWVIDLAGRLVGLSCTWVLGDEAHLLRIATHGAARRQGLGRIMLTDVLEHAAAAGCRRVLLEVAAGNEPAVRLYQALDFEPIGRRPGYYTRPPDDALVMRRSLDSPEVAAEPP